MEYVAFVFIIVLLIMVFVGIISKQNQKYKQLQEQKNTEVEQQKQQLAAIQQKITTYTENLQREKQTYENAKRLSDEQQIEMQSLNRQRQTLTASIDDQKKELSKIRCAATEAQNMQIELQNNIAALQKDLDSLKSQHKAATKLIDTSNIGLTLKGDDRCTRLHNTLEKLKNEYIELADCFSAAQWSKIWQPLFKTMTTEIQNKCGIYRIFTIDQQTGIQRSYVGQAKDIRDRWSEHIKKMCGVKNLTKQDDAKFYSNVAPFNAHFEIIEECRESDLNEKEHYWIDYYNCVSDGYNTKN